MRPRFRMKKGKRIPLRERQLKRIAGMLGDWNLSTAEKKLVRPVMKRKVKKEKK